MVPHIDQIVSEKAKALASLKRLGTITVPHITPPVTRQMWLLTNSLAHTLPLASVSSVTRIKIWTVKNTWQIILTKKGFPNEETTLLCLLQSWSTSRLWGPCCLCKSYSRRHPTGVRDYPQSGGLQVGQFYSSATKRERFECSHKGGRSPLQCCRYPRISNRRSCCSC